LAGLSMWLVPTQEECHKLTRILHIRPSQAKSPSSYPPIDPHVTLAAFPSDTDLDRVRDSIPPDQPKIPVAFKSIDIGQVYFRSVYAACQPSAALLQLHKAVHERIKLEPKTPSYPHMSMYYIDDSEAEERTRIRDELVRQGKIRKVGEDSVGLDCGEGDFLTGFEGAEIWIVSCEGPVPEWRVLEKVPLV
ncbi:LigT-like protein, partial [Heliocybe sulcata]